MTSAIRDYLLLHEEQRGYKTTRSRLGHVVQYIAETNPELTVPQADERFANKFRTWLSDQPVVKGKSTAARSLGHVEGCVRQLAAVINATAGQAAQFKAEQPKNVSKSPVYRADIKTIAEMFRFCVDPPPPANRQWSDKEKLMVASSRSELHRYLRAAVATWARPDAIFDIRREHWYPDARVLDLSPVRRRQTDKYRPMIPIARQFAASLNEMLPGPDGPGRLSYLTNNTVRHGWDSMRKALGLPGDREAGEKLVRRSMATLARKRMSAGDWPQGKMMLGHEKYHTSDIYAVPSDELMGRVLETTEAIIDEIEALCPGAFTAILPQPQSRRGAQKEV